MQLKLKTNPIAASIHNHRVAPIIAQHKQDDLFYTILTLKTLDSARMVGFLGWDLWHRDEDLEKSYVMCEYAKQLIKTEIKQHSFEAKYCAKNKMLTSLTRLVGLPHKPFWKAINKILNNPDIDGYL